MPFLLNAGNFQSGGSPVANGVLTLTLSNPTATVIATGLTATASYTITLDANGNIPAGTTVLGNSELTPTGTFYTASLVTSGGVTVSLAKSIWVVGPSAPYAGTLFPDVNVYPPLSINGTIPGALSITGNGGLPTASGTNLWIAGNFGSPTLGKIYVGDGTGWELDFAKRTASADTTLFKFKDSGIMDSSAGYQYNGGAPSGNVLRGNGTSFVAAQLSASDLSNGSTGSGAIVLATSPTLTTPIIGSAGATFNGSTSGTTILKASATASGTLTLPAATDQLIGRATTDTITNKTVGAGGLAGLTVSKQIFTSSGTFTIPSGVASAKVTVVGAGGGGGGAGATANASGTGGGGGGCAIKWLTGLTPGNTLTVTVGTGGAGSSGAAGATGGSSSVASGTQTISTISSSGGGGGAANGNAVGATGGTASGGDLNFTGGNPGIAIATTNAGGGGGNSIFGGGGNGGFRGSPGSGGTGGAPGAGGGGAGGNAGGNVAGSAGANGIVIFEWMI
jgi:hypothetical protein